MLGLGEKLFEEKGASTSQAIKSIGPEGITLEGNFGGEIKGSGRMKGVDGRYMATAIATQKGALVIGTFQGVFTTNKGETVTIKGHGTGKTQKGKFRGANIATFNTDSRRLSLMNSTISFWEVTADPKFLEFSGIAYEWK
jgi:hypothetical protein